MGGGWPLSLRAVTHLPKVILNGPLLNYDDFFCLIGQPLSYGNCL